MPDDKRANLSLMFGLVVSIFGCVTAISIALRSTSMSEDVFWRKPLVGSIFTLICISGSLLAISPKKALENLHVRGVFGRTGLSRGNPAFNRKHIALVGHHPSCGRFSAHTVYMEGRVLCAACVGLFLGGISALSGTILYFFGSLDLGRFGLYPVLVGQVGILVGFAQFKFIGRVRMIVNAVFVFSAYLTLVGIDGMTRSFWGDIYTTALIVFWLWTRMRISQWDHDRICYKCGHMCEV
jgi:hypothetical protein